MWLINDVHDIARYVPIMSRKSESCNDCNLVNLELMQLAKAAINGTYKLNLTQQRFIKKCIFVSSDSVKNIM